MKYYIALLIVTCCWFTNTPLAIAATTGNGAPVPRTSFQPTKSHPADKKISIVMQNCSMSEFGPLLANLSGQEVLVSERIRTTLIPDLVINDYPEKVMEAVIGRIKDAKIRIAELPPFTLVCFESPQPLSGQAIESK